MGLALISIFGEDPVAQTLIFPGLVGTPARLTKAGFVFLGVRCSKSARIAPRAGDSTK
jgi:hypothetical protein